MKKITKDTNVLVSAPFWNGDSAKIIDKVENKELILVLSEKILGGYNKVLEYKEIKEKIRNKDLEMKKAMFRIGVISQIVEVKSKIEAVKEDPDDNKIIECAVDGGSEFIISKDKHLLKLKEYKGIKILSPEEFLKI